MEISRLLDLSNQKFFKLLVVKRDENNKHKQVQWLCRCECGNIVSVTSHKLRTGHTKSCGCYRNQKLRENRFIHGETGTKLYIVWQGMCNRCKNKNTSNYERYGGRGISVCAEWEKDYKKFYNWAMFNGYTDGLTIDRIDNNGDYCPENCRWVSYTVQSRNKKDTIFITHNNETKSLYDWADELQIDGRRLYDRIHNLGWSFEKSINTPIRKGNYLWCNNKRSNT